jgi:hypothetical protein
MAGELMVACCVQSDRSSKNNEWVVSMRKGRDNLRMSLDKFIILSPPLQSHKSTSFSTSSLSPRYYLLYETSKYDSLWTALQ